MSETYKKLTMLKLRELAKDMDIKSVTKYKKQELIDLITEKEKNNNNEEKKSEATLKVDKKVETVTKTENKQDNRVTTKRVVRENNIPVQRNDSFERPVKPLKKEQQEDRKKINNNNDNYVTEKPVAKERTNNNFNRDNKDKKSSSGSLPSEIEQLDSGQIASGVLEVLPDGYGFIRCENYLPGSQDVYVSPSQIRRLNMKTGDAIVGNIRIQKDTEKFSALLYVQSINGDSPMSATRRPNFEDLTPIFPTKRIHLENKQRDYSNRLIDLLAPVGKGQRGMIVAPPKAGKTTILKKVANSITHNHKDISLIVLLIDERPEEVTDIRRSIEGENVDVIHSTFDELPEHHKRVSEMVLERAKRLVEHKKDVVILLDSITRLARAYNLTIPPSGRTLSGGLDPAALHMPKKFFGAARNIEEGGSLTILATALVETGSKMDEVIFEEFKGTGNMEVVLDRRLSEKRIFPAIDLLKSGTRREDLLLSPQEKNAVYRIRKSLGTNRYEDELDHLLKIFTKCQDNEEFVKTLNKMR